MGKKKGKVASQVDQVVNRLVLDYLNSTGRRDAAQLLMKDGIYNEETSSECVLNGKGLVDLVKNCLSQQRKADQLVSLSRRLELFSRELTLLSKSWSGDAPVAQSAAFGYTQGHPTKPNQPKKKLATMATATCRRIIEDPESETDDVASTSRLSTPTYLTPQPVMESPKNRRKLQPVSKTQELSNQQYEDYLNQLLELDFPEILAGTIEKATTDGRREYGLAVQNAVDFVEHDQAVSTTLECAFLRHQQQQQQRNLSIFDNQTTEDENWFTWDPSAENSQMNDLTSRQDPITTLMNLEPNGVEVINAVEQQREQIGAVTASDRSVTPATVSLVPAGQSEVPPAATTDDDQTSTHVEVPLDSTLTNCFTAPQPNQPEETPESSVLADFEG